MREILFRGKRLQGGEWVEGYFFKSDINKRERESGKATLIFTPDCDTFIMVPECHNSFMVVSDTVGQYTGLKDKNGKRIFEGDIVECVSWNEYFSISDCSLFQNFRRVMVVVFHNGAFRMKESMPDPLRPNYWDLIYDGDIEVIGNIYDNPEFLEK